MPENMLNRPPHAECPQCLQNGEDSSLGYTAISLPIVRCRVCGHVFDLVTVGKIVWMGQSLTLSDFLAKHLVPVRG